MEKVIYYANGPDDFDMEVVKMTPFDIVGQQMAVISKSIRSDEFPF